MTQPRILIAGVGNIFFGDDAFGVEVAARLAERALPAHVRLIDFGIRGFDLALALLEGYETAILVDAAPRGGPPGTLYLIEPPWNDSAPPPEAAAQTPASLDAHSMDPARVLRFAGTLGGPLPRVLLVGCEPTPAGGDDVPMGLSQPVRAAVDEAVQMIESLIGKLSG